MKFITKILNRLGIRTAAQKADSAKRSQAQKAAWARKKAKQTTVT